jgi:hypothetical protein
MWLVWGIILGNLLVWGVQERTPPMAEEEVVLPVIDLTEPGYRAVRLPDLPASALQGASDPDNPYAVLRISGPGGSAPHTAAPHTAAPGEVVHLQIALSNYEAVTRTYRLTTTLPTALTYLPAPDGRDDLTYDPETHTLGWQGVVAPGHLDYRIETSSVALPYLDLADYGAPDWCAAAREAGQGCDDLTVTINLGRSGYSANLYGQVVHQLTITPQGTVGAGDADDGPVGQPRWLPETAVSGGILLAPLWRAVQLDGVGENDGRFHAGIVRGLVAGYDVLYVQWHDIPQAHQPSLTARHALALLLDGGGPRSGQLFYIYDNIANPAQLVAQGYTIGLTDAVGERGQTYAYAPAPGAGGTPQGYPPAAGTTLHLLPVLFGAQRPYQRLLTYDVQVAPDAPEQIIQTAVATSDSPASGLATLWASHYLAVRWQGYLPFLISGEGP